MPSADHDHADLRGKVCQTLERLAGMAHVHGGVVAGGRALTFVIDEVDHEALDSRLQSLPLWDCVETIRATPLVSFQARLAHNQKPSLGGPA